jgi:hypothetical protein
MKTKYFIKIGLIFILFLSLVTTIQSQTTNRYEVLVSNGYADFIRKGFQYEGVYKGRYSYGLAFRYRLGKGERFLHTKIGLAYFNLSQMRTVNNIPNYLGNFKEAIHYHMISIPFHLIFDNNKWRAGLQAAYEAPIYHQNVFRDISASGDLEEKERRGSSTSLWIGRGFGFGAFFGKTLKLENGKTFFVEGEYKAFDVTRPLRKHDYYEMKNIFPYWVGMNIGMGF